MSVARQLGLDDPGSGLLQLARSRWPVWQERHPVLRLAETVDDLPSVTRASDRATVNRVQQALGRLGSRDGGNEAAATAVLIWLLLPGAVSISRRLERAVPGIGGRQADQLVAGQMWIEARSFCDVDTARTNHGGTILRNAERAILCELGIHERSDRMWRESRSMDPLDLALFCPASNETAPTAPGDEVQSVLAGALAAGVVSRADVDLLLDVARTAGRMPQRIQREMTGMAGLCSGPVSEAVATRRGITSRTVRRRTRATIFTIREAHLTRLGRSA